MNVGFWDKRYKRAGFEWGQEPSFVGELAAKIMRDKNLQTVLDIGCGYGRDCIFLAKLGFKATGIDTSSEGLKLARQWAKDENLEVDFKQIDVTKNQLTDDSFDAVIMYNTFHLMEEKERNKTVEEIKRLLKRGGILIQVAMSTDDKEFGKGVEVEKNSFDFKGGRPLHFFSRNEIESVFSAFDLIKLEEVDVHEVHSGGEEHTHTEWLIIAEKD